MEEKKKRNNATITFSTREQKMQLLERLNSVQLQNLMPESARQKDCQKVIWAVDYLYDLAVKGKIRVQVPMYEEDSMEKQGMLDEIDRLKKEVETLKKQLQLHEDAAPDEETPADVDFEMDAETFVAMMQPLEQKTLIKRIQLKQ